MSFIGGSTVHCIAQLTVNHDCTCTLYERERVCVYPVHKPYLNDSVMRIIRPWIYNEAAVTPL